MSSLWHLANAYDILFLLKTTFRVNIIVLGIRIRVRARVWVRVWVSVGVFQKFIWTIVNTIYWHWVWVIYSKLLQEVENNLSSGYPIIVIYVLVWVDLWPNCWFVTLWPRSGSCCSATVFVRTAIALYQTIPDWHEFWYQFGLEYPCAWTCTALASTYDYY